jgi:hypothetical protein
MLKDGGAFLAVDAGEYARGSPVSSTSSIVSLTWDLALDFCRQLMTSNSLIRARRMWATFLASPLFHDALKCPFIREAVKPIS